MTSRTLLALAALFAAAVLTGPAFADPPDPKENPPFVDTRHDGPGLP